MPCLCPWVTIPANGSCFGGALGVRPLSDTALRQVETQLRLMGWMGGPARRQCSPALLSCPREVPKGQRPANTVRADSHVSIALVLLPSGQSTRWHCTSKSGSLQLRRHDDDCKERGRYYVCPYMRSRRASNSMAVALRMCGSLAVQRNNGRSCVPVAARFSHGNKLTCDRCSSAYYLVFFFIFRSWESRTCFADLSCLSACAGTRVGNGGPRPEIFCHGIKQVDSERASQYGVLRTFWESGSGCYSRALFAMAKSRSVTEALQL